MHYSSISIGKQIEELTKLNVDVHEHLGYVQHFAQDVRPDASCDLKIHDEQHETAELMIFAPGGWSAHTCWAIEILVRACSYGVMYNKHGSQVSLNRKRR